MKLRLLSFILISAITGTLSAQLWTPDLGNGRFKNPILYADYSDPDMIKVGDDFYMVASSFNCMPGIPILHSKDLVNWTIINHVFDALPYQKFDKPAHGLGAWAPSIRFNDNKFYVYVCTPDEGLFVAVTDDPHNKWELHHVVDVALWEDPCPLWDDDGNAYLVRSKLCGNELFLHKMSADGLTLLDNGISIYRDESQPTIEGPKLIKRNGYYYILAPAGGVSEGWQTVLRSKNIYGPYDVMNVLHQGNTNVNGPHQGGLVELESGESWFMHFQDKPPYGRIVHLQPVKWVDNWPLLGEDINDDGIGEPVLEYNKPNVGKIWPIATPPTTDEFNNGELGLQWQWHANPKHEWFVLMEGQLQLNAVKNIGQNGSLWLAPNLLLQKFPAPEFSVTTKIEFNGELVGEQAGLVIMGAEWAFIVFEKTAMLNQIAMYNGTYNRCDPATDLQESISTDENSCYFRVTVADGGLCSFSFSFDNMNFTTLGKPFQAKSGRWIGAKVGLFNLNPNMQESKGYAKFDWVRFE